MTTLGTTQKWLSWAYGSLIKHLSKTATKQMWSFLAGFKCFFFPTIIFAFAIVHFGIILKDQKYKLLFFLNVHILSKDGCSTVRLTPKLKSSITDVWMGCKEVSWATMSGAYQE